MTCLDVTLPSGAYTIHIGMSALAKAAPALADACPGKKAAVVTDENVWWLHGPALKDVLHALGISFRPIVIPPGEGSKSLTMLERLYNAFCDFELLRGDPVIAFGGGVVGDLAGFAASTYMRGVPLIQIPTTLLAQVDSSVGGKVAVNLREGKNLVGSFYQPCLVIADTELLSTLPQREWNAGMAEVVKYAAIGNIDGNGNLPVELSALIRKREGHAARLERIVTLCCSCKAGYVERDERDTSVRMILNFGHTFGHAIERLHAYKTYNHGEAVAMGMALAVRAGELLGVSEPGTENDLLLLMEAAGLQSGCSDNIENLIPLMAGDKKNTGEGLSLILLNRMGMPFLYKTTQDKLLALFRKGKTPCPM